MQCGFYRGGFMKEKRLVAGVFMCVHASLFQHEENKKETLPGDICKQFVTSGKIVWPLVRKIKLN
jgi:hypothetical protein